MKEGISLLAAWLLIWICGLAATGLALKLMWIVFMAGWGLL